MLGTREALEKIPKKAQAKLKQYRDLQGFTGLYIIII